MPKIPNMRGPYSDAGMVTDSNSPKMLQPGAKDSLHGDNVAGMEYTTKGGVPKDNLGAKNTRKG